MKITDITTYAVTIPLKPEFRMVSALGQHNVSNYVLVKVDTDEGFFGVGEASITVRWSGETTWGTTNLIEQVLAPAIKGMNPLDIAGVDGRMDQIAANCWFAKSAIEMACWDIQGKAAEKPVYELLGGTCRPAAMRSRFSMGAYDVERAGRRAIELVDMGFTTIKVKVGGLADDDIARVRAVREAIGDELDIFVDANCGWDVETAIFCLKQLEDCRIAWVEQPTAKGDHAAMAQVRDETGARILADDSCFDLVDAQELIRSDCCDAISLYPGKNGGIRKARQIAKLAEEHNVACSIGSNLEWDIATAAMAHFIVATPNMKVEDIPGDILGPIYHESRIATNPVSIDGPITVVPDGPGLGVEVDWDFVKHNAAG